MRRKFNDLGIRKTLKNAKLRAIRVVPHTRSTALVYRDLAKGSLGFQGVETGSKLSTEYQRGMAKVAIWALGAKTNAPV